jgi:hypothetical protein
MAHRGPKGNQRGHGPSQAMRRYAWPSRSNRSRSDVAFLKTWGSRPEYKRREARRAA